MRLDDIKDPDAAELFEVEHDGIKLQCVSTLSTEYNDYIHWVGRRAAKGMIDLDSAKDTGDVNRRGAAHLVKRWNLEDEPTLENVTDLFRRKRELQDKVMIQAGRAAEALGKSQENCTTIAKSSTDSPSE